VEFSQQLLKVRRKLSGAELAQALRFIGRSTRDTLNM
jgi:hypothetical protein